MIRPAPPRWDEAPAEVRAAVEEVPGAPVVANVDQPAGRAFQREQGRVAVRWLRERLG